MSLAISVLIALFLGATPLDKIVLKNGQTFEGKIILETEHYLEIRIGEGQVIGMHPDEISKVVRDLIIPETPAENIPVEIAPYQEWYLVEDRAGRPVAHFQTSLRPDQKGELPVFILEERWTFLEQNQKVSWVETLGPDFLPRELVYREEAGGQGRVVLASFDKAGNLKVEVRGGEKKRNYSLPWSPDCRFPLGSLGSLRRQAFGARSAGTFMVFHPTRAVFEKHRFFFERKKVVSWEGEEIAVRVLKEETETVTNEIWIDSRGGILRREVNGSDLIARRASAEELKSLLDGEVDLNLRPGIADPLGRYRLQLPDPSWEVVPGGADPGVILLDAGREGASALLFFVDAQTDRAEPRGHLAVVERRLDQALADFRRNGKIRERVVQGRSAIQFSFLFSDTGKPRSGIALVIGGASEFLVLLYSSPVQDRNLIPAAWEKLIAGLELTGGSIPQESGTEDR